jgi:thiamine kinase-like enzyme
LLESGFDSIKEGQIKDYLVEALNISGKDIKDIQPFGGMTNINYKVLIKNKEYVLRLAGNGTEKMINRKEEKVNLFLASKMGFDTEVLYFNEQTGMKITELIPEAETLTSQVAKRKENMELIAATLRKLHQSDMQMANRFDVFYKIGEYEQLMREAKGIPYKGYEEVKAQVMVLKDLYTRMDVALTPCHNDLVPENIVKRGHNKIYLIDWEYSGINDPMWDVAAHSLECGFSPEEEELFLSLYLNQQKVPLEIQQRVLINKIFQDFLWSIWTIIKEANGDDFESYGIDRFNRARRNLQHDLIKELANEDKK